MSAAPLLVARAKSASCGLFLVGPRRKCVWQCDVANLFWCLWRQDKLNLLASHCAHVSAMCERKYSRRTGLAATPTQLAAKKSCSGRAGASGQLRRQLDLRADRTSNEKWRPPQEIYRNFGGRKFARTARWPAKRREISARSLWPD